MTRLLTIADDFTGALDTGVQFAARGARTCVVTDPAYDFSRAEPEIQVLVLDAETRHLSPEAAYKAVFRAVEDALAAGFTHIYKKTDSALRGNLGTELMAAARTAGVRPVPFLPAWPENGRTTLAGVHYIHGAPLAETDLAADVLNPITSSRVAEILSTEESLDVKIVAAGERIWPCTGDVLVFDAQTGEHVDTAAELLCRRGMLRLTAGCARLLQGLSSELASVLPRREKTETGELGTVLLACGSLNPASLRQVRYAVRHLGYRLVSPDGAPAASGPAVIPEGRRLLLRSNRAENLELCSQSENTKYSMIPGKRRTTKNPRKRKAFKCFSPVIQLGLDGSEIRQWESPVAIKHSLGFSDWSIKQCCLGKRKQAYGYMWQYAT